MKKLSIGLLAAALSLPFAFGATQSTPSSTQAQTPAPKTTKKHTYRKKHANKKSTGAQSNNNANPQSTSKTPSGK